MLLSKKKLKKYKVKKSFWPRVMVRGSSDSKNKK